MARERYLLNTGDDTIHANEIELKTLKDKGKNWWYYHKRHLIVGIIAALLVGNLIWSLVSQVEPDYTIALLTSYTMPENGKQQLEECIAQYADDRNGDGKVTVEVSNYIFSESVDYQVQQASMVRFVGECSTNEAMIFLHDEAAFQSVENIFEGFFQYNDGEPMPDEARDYENAMVFWDSLQGFSNFVPQTAEDDTYDSEVLSELYSRLRVSRRTAEGSSIEKKEKDMAYYQDSMALYDRILNDEKLGGEPAGEEG